MQYINRVVCHIICLNDLFIKRGRREEITQSDDVGVVMILAIEHTMCHLSNIRGYIKRNWREDISERSDHTTKFITVNAFTILLLLLVSVLN